MAQPLVTVLVDTYNHERFVEEAIVSVLEQDFPRSDMQILVVDDGSTDRTPEILRKFEPHVRVLRKANGGQATAFNTGIPEARGEVVAFLDGDDWWAKNKLTRVIETMTADPSIGLVGHGIVVVERSGQQQAETLREGFRFRASTVEGARLLRRRGCFLGTSRMTVRRNVLEQIGPVPDRIVVQADEYLFTLAAVLTDAEILREPLAYYRYHEANGFQMARYEEAAVRRKQESLAALAQTLDQQLRDYGIDVRTRKDILEYTKASAEQLRLILDGGWSWETALTEWSLYRVTHSDAPVLHRAFKISVLTAAMAVPPRVFYRLRRKIVGNDFYLRARQWALPIPEMRHIKKDPQTGL
jgi:cellulose synthase/poly-beta-1,6-N-acetylglucosamine synthase-like glycosyltransferase